MYLGIHINTRNDVVAAANESQALKHVQEEVTIFSTRIDSVCT